MTYPLVHAEAGEARGTRTVISPPHRRQLPTRRQSETHNVEVGNTRLSATVGFYPESIPAELFLGGANDGTDMAAILEDASVVISVALQHGIPARTLAKSVARLPTAALAPPYLNHLAGIRPAASVIGAALDLLSELDARERKR
jgi:hypothetical protein